MTFELDEVTALSLLEGCDLAEDVEAIPPLRHRRLAAESSPSAPVRAPCAVGRSDNSAEGRKAIMRPAAAAAAEFAAEE